MTDKKTTSTDEDRRLAREWAESVESYPDIWARRIRAAARVILDTVPALPNLSDMSHVARRECQWMRCDVAGEDGEWLIIDPFDDESHAHVADRLGDTRVLPTHHVIPRPDLPRMEWAGSKKHAPALPDGWRLAEHKEHGRVIITKLTPDDDGDVYFTFPADDLTGYDWDACSPDELTYLEQGEG